MRFYKEIFHKNDLKLDSNNFIERKAVRAVIIKEGKILLIHLKDNDEYKFPGGGADNVDETPYEILEREVKEESGAIVKRMHEKLGEVIEFNKQDDDVVDYFKMISEYYAVEIEDELGEQDLDPWEKDLKFVPVWIDINEAFNVNSHKLSVSDNSKSKWIKRETYVLGELRNCYRG
jgi:ADP-ribose pyrophosphatase YjhB (NUDIX family)